VPATRFRRYIWICYSMERNDFSRWL